MTHSKTATLSLALMLACGPSDNDPGGDGGPTVDAALDSGPAADGGPGADGCVPEIAIICSAGDVVARDLCTGASTMVETCPNECAAGRCVDCAPGAYRACVDDEVWTFDSCGAAEALAEACSNGCAAGACIAAECTPDASRVCIGQTVYRRDSCGNLGAAVQICDPSDTDVGACVDGACEGCGPANFLTCYDGDVYGTDACGNLDVVEERCEGATPRCEAASCVAGEPCTPHPTQVVCFQGNMHRFDTCGGVIPEIHTRCPSGCDSTGCVACVPVAAGTTCQGGHVHELLGGCPGVPGMAGARVEMCEHGCAEGACLPEGCTPNAGRICRSGDVYAVDSCGASGALVESCHGLGCTSGRCEAPPECECNLTSDERLSCEVGSLSCGGCVGQAGTCDDRALCATSCEGEFFCVEGDLYYSRFELYLGTCAACASCASPPCEGCVDPALCAAVCSDG